VGSAISKTTTHLLTTREAFDLPSDKVTDAQAAGLTIVSEDFVRDSVKQGSLAQATHYSFVVPAKSSPESAALASQSAAPAAQEDILIHTAAADKRATYSPYLCKLVREVQNSPNMDLSKKGMAVMNVLLNDIFERIASEAAKLTRDNGRATLTSHEIQAAALQALPGQLGKHAVKESTKAITNFTKSK
jgi:histone H2B